MKAVSGKAAVLRNVGGPFVVETVEFEAPRDDEVRVKISAVGMCHTDIVARDGFPVPMPIVLGHEGAGVVESVGSKVTRVKPGDHVVLSFDSCGQCPTCKEHKPAYCLEFLPRNFGGPGRADGSSALSKGGEKVHSNFFGQSSFGSYAIAHERNTVAIDKSLPLEIMGPLGCGIQTGAGAVANSLQFKKGQTLTIFGGGAVGLSALMAAVALGSAKTIVVEPNAERGKLALSLGASHVINPKETADVLAKIKELTGGGGTSHAVDTTGIPAVINTAFETMLSGGTLALIAVPPPDGVLSINLMNLLIRGVGVKSITEGDSDPQVFIPQMIEWYKAGKFPFDRLITKFPIEQINEAAHASEKGVAIKPVLTLA